MALAGGWLARALRADKRALLLTLWLALVLASCSGSVLSRGGTRDVVVPAYATLYTTSAGADGVRGGGAARDAEVELRRRLAGRGDSAQPDGALAATAAWALRRAYAGETVADTRLLTDAARRFGFTGLVEGFVVMPLSDPRAPELLGSMLSGVPGNSPVNRYGITSGQGSDVALLVGAVEVELEDFPRALPPGGQVRLRGDVSPRFERASVFATDPDGNVREIAMKSRVVDATLEFPRVGTYSLELMGYGASGPVVLMNVPVLVGVSERDEGERDAAVDPNLTPEAAAAEMLELLNQERQKRGLRPVDADAELAEIALSHSRDMVEHDFFGHVSPITGSPEARIQKSGVRVAKAGECVALEVTPLGAHRGLLASPAHRAAMLDGGFTHVGIGVAFGDDGSAPRRLRVTLLFGRRVAPEEIRQSPEAIFEAIQVYRKAQNLNPIRLDPALTAIANAGTQALANGNAKTAQEALAESARELQRSVNRARVSRSVCQTFIEILERAQLASLGLLRDPELKSVGVGVVELVDGKGSRLGVLVAGEATRGKSLRCE
ncbi:MAG: CAP domain-containing protein [Myxococcota bacterium]